MTKSTSRSASSASTSFSPRELFEARWMPCDVSVDRELLRQIGARLEARSKVGLRHFSAMNRTVELPYSRQLAKPARA